MPTGYTAIIEDNPETVTFKEYLLRCARAFGACIEQRDESLNQPPRKRSVDQYYYDALNEAKQELVTLQNMSEKQIIKEFDNNVRDINKRNEESIRKHMIMQNAYARIRQAAEAWVPPTSDHENLKKFMIEQIDLCYNKDSKPYLTEIPSSVLQFHEDRLEAAKHTVEYRERDLKEEIERAQESSGWLQKVFNSIKQDI